MKKMILIAAILLVTGFSNAIAQKHNRPPSLHPIPSFNYPITTLNTAFQETSVHGLPSREKRDMDVVISTSSTSTNNVSATVYIVKEYGTTVLGPFTVYPDQVLEVPIDYDQWGVVIQCDDPITASVWIE